MRRSTGDLLTQTQTHRSGLPISEFLKLTSEFPPTKTCSVPSRSSSCSKRRIKTWNWEKRFSVGSQCQSYFTLICLDLQWKRFRFTDKKWSWSFGSLSWAVSQPTCDSTTFVHGVVFFIVFSKSTHSCGGGFVAKQDGTCLSESSVLSWPDRDGSYSLARKLVMAAVWILPVAGLCSSKS